MSSIPSSVKSSSPRVTIPGTRFHKLRRMVQSICVTIFILLPLFDVMRIDITRQRFYVFGAELWISEFSILFLTMMFVWILVAASAMIYGRFYCGYLCPQMIFSEAATTLERAIAKWVKHNISGTSDAAKKLVARGLFYIALLPAAVFVTFVFVSFFVPPADLLHRLLHLDIRTAPGIVGASITLITFLDFAFLRQRFCTAICPYGYLQNMLADKKTLLVRFYDPNEQCIKCQKCVQACPMGIDIRNSSHQLECTHCAECVDACSAIVGKLGRTSLIQYAWGEGAEAATKKLTWYQRIGLRDGKRIAIMVLLFIYATGLSVAIRMRQPVMIRVMPNRITLYSVAPDGRVLNHFRILAVNRSHADTHVTLSVTGIGSAEIVGIDKDVLLKPGESLQHDFDVAASAAGVQPGINKMQLQAAASAAQKPATFDENFFAPTDAIATPKSVPATAR